MLVQNLKQPGFIRSAKIVRWENKPVKPFLLEYDDEDEINRTWVSLPNRRIIFEEELSTHRENVDLGTEKVVFELERLGVREAYDARILDTIQKLSEITDQEDDQDTDISESSLVEEEEEEVGVFQCLLYRLLMMHVS